MCRTIYRSLRFPSLLPSHPRSSFLVPFVFPSFSSSVEKLPHTYCGKSIIYEYHNRSWKALVLTAQHRDSAGATALPTPSQTPHSLSGGTQNHHQARPNPAQGTQATGARAGSARGQRGGAGGAGGVNLKQDPEELVHVEDDDDDMGDVPIMLPARAPAAAARGGVAAALPAGRRAGAAVARPQPAPIPPPEERLPTIGVMNPYSDRIRVKRSFVFNGVQGGFDLGQMTTAEAACREHDAELIRQVRS